MKKNLGKFLIFLLLCFNAYASEYKWSVYSSKKEAFVNEAIYLKYVCEFSDRAELYSIEFNPVMQNEIYTIKPFSQNIKIEDGKKINTYEYIAFVHKPMLMDFSFDILMKKTNDDSIQTTTLGRDNLEKEEFIVTALKQESIKVNIKESATDIFGKFTLNVKQDEPQVKAYEPYHLDIKISGTGDFEDIKPIAYKIDGVKVFSQKPIQNIKLTKDGYKGEWNQKFAFVGDKDFVIPALNIEYFDGSVKSLNVKQTDVKVQESFKKEELLDEVESEIKIDFEIIYYILTFIAGFLVAKIKFKTNKVNSKEKLFIEKVKNTKSINELSMLLILNNQKKFNEILLELDSGKLTSLDKTKRKVLKLIDN